MPGRRTIFSTVFILIICPGVLGNPQNRNEVPDPVLIVLLPDIQYNDQFSDINGLNLKMDHLLNTVAGTNPLYVIIGNHADDQLGSNPVKESLIYQSDIYYPNWIKQLSRFDITWYTVFNDNNLGGEKWHDHKSVIFEVYQ